MTDAPLLNKPQRWDMPFSAEFIDAGERREMTEAELDRLLSREPFASMDEDKFPRSTPLREIIRNDCRLRRYRDGDVVVRQGDYGNSAFLILDGDVRVFLEGLDPQILGRRKPKRKSWLKSLLQPLTNPRSAEVRDPRDYVPYDQDEDQSPHEVVYAQGVTNILKIFPDAYEKTRNDKMHAGELFGELAALGRIPRSTTIVADGEAELLEIRWQGLRDLRKYDEALKQYIDERYRRFGLAAALRASPLLVNLHGDQLQEIANHAVFETFGTYDWYGSYRQLRQKHIDPLSKEPVIAEEGHHPNGLILIRSGFARVSRQFGDGHQTISYLGKGDVFGLRELYKNAKTGEAAPFEYTLRAIGYVDVVRIATRTFEDLVMPHLPDDAIPSEKSIDYEPAADPDDAMQRFSRGTESLDPGMMEFLVEHRFINGSATMIIDTDRCTRCDDCVRACATGHGNNPVFVRHGPIHDHYMVANACMHCADPVCMIGCPTGAIHRDENTGIVEINDVTCIGCQTCAASCPYDNIRMVEIRDGRSDDEVMTDPRDNKPILKATKCDLCVDDRGGPACERACPHDALKRVDLRKPENLGKWMKR